jgi:hypothetical protein
MDGMIQLQGMTAGTSLPDRTSTTNVPKFNATDLSKKLVAVDVKEAIATQLR